MSAGSSTRLWSNLPGQRAGSCAKSNTFTLYRIESQLRHGKAGPKLREAVRAHQTRPIIVRLKKALILFKASRRHLPQSLLGQAIDYALGQWHGLEVFLRDGRVEGGGGQ